MFDGAAIYTASEALDMLGDQQSLQVDEKNLSSDLNPIIENSNSRKEKSKLYISVLAPLLIGFFIGVLTGLTGIGGGFILIPCMIYFLGMKTISVIGTSLFNITIVSFVSLFLQIYINQNIDFVLALGLIVSSSIGAALAARIVDILDQENLKVTFGMLLLIISSFLAYDLFRTPENLFIINYV